MVPIELCFTHSFYRLHLGKKRTELSFPNFSTFLVKNTRLFRYQNEIISYLYLRSNIPNEAPLFGSMVKGRQQSYHYYFGFNMCRMIRAVKFFAIYRSCKTSSLIATKYAKRVKAIIFIPFLLYLLFFFISVLPSGIVAAAFWVCPKIFGVVIY